ncbi:MAG: cytochrome c oxidase assembly factor 1 family protein [Planctomycetes bacterium]|nr:cytochrome c oxidase assembly factor 1 family protein [Planctomycetota bacterium]
MNQATPRTWWNRNWKWAVPVGCITPLVCCGGFAGLILTIIFGAMRSSDVYKDAVSRATADVRVKELLGEPIEPGLFTTGNINVHNDSGDADLSIPLSGPKGSATLHVVAEKSGGKWECSELEVQPATGAPAIDLLEKPE